MCAFCYGRRYWYAPIEIDDIWCFLSLAIESDAVFWVRLLLLLLQFCVKKILRSFWCSIWCATFVSYGSSRNTFSDGCVSEHIRSTQYFFVYCFKVLNYSYCWLNCSTYYCVLVLQTKMFLRWACETLCDCVIFGVLDPNAIGCYDPMFDSQRSTIAIWQICTNNLNWARAS